MIPNMDTYKFGLIVTLTIGFTLAILLGYFSHRAKLSPILGYLLAGYAIGPFSPGFVANLEIAEQLAEIGVVLMMFGVGLHFRWEDLISVRNIAIPGAIGQTLVSALVGAGLVYSMGWTIHSGIILGLAIGVASTMVLVRVLTDNHLLKTREGHIAIGWLIVEDILTVFVLLLIPTLAAFSHGGELSAFSIAGTILYSLLKFIALILIMFTVGRKCVVYILSKIVLTNSHELFTLAILALTFIIAAGSAFLFGTSIALGAFIAGMVIGKTDVRHQVSLNATPLRDAFVVIFFLSTGMLFNPSVIYNHFFLFLGVLATILFVKPIVAYIITIAFRHPVRVASIIAVALAQIGEFSFILAEEASRVDLLPNEGYDAIVACALITIAFNPPLFKLTLSYLDKPKT